jgi:hypothetical protein
MKAHNKARLFLINLVCDIAIFVVVSYGISVYELSTGANIFYEGIGYILFIPLLYAGYSFVKDIIGLQNFLHSLSLSENTAFSGGEICEL